jgi:DNA mismatch endonuclease (patch repair protein)
MLPDIYTKEKRSEVMSKIKSRDTKIELKLKNELESQNIEHEYQPKIFGRPDFFVPPNIVVFCDSSFWHGRYWPKLKPRLKEGYWREHIASNRKRDRIVNRYLRSHGYVVLRFWDVDIERRIRKCAQRVVLSMKYSKSINEKTHKNDQSSK